VIPKTVDQGIPNGAVAADEQGFSKRYPNVIHHQIAAPEVRNREIGSLSDGLAMLVQTLDFLVLLRISDL
jgi:hypothetical protein